MDTQVTAVAHTCLVLAEIHSAQINRVARILQGPWCAHLRHESRREGDDLHHKPRIVLCISRNTAFSRVSVTRCSDTQLCQLAQQSTETPKLLKEHRRRTAGGQMGGSPKAPTTASGRGNQPPGGNPESNRGFPGPRDIKRVGHKRLGTSVKTALSISARAKVQSQPRSSPRWGNSCSRAQWKISSTTSFTFAGHKKNGLPRSRSA